MSSPRIWRRALPAALASALAAIALTAGTSEATPTEQPTGPYVDRAVYAQLATSPSTEFLVHLAGTADLSGADQLTGKAARGRHVRRELMTAAAASQAPLRSMLTDRGITHTPYWITNVILVEGDRALADEIVTWPGVTAVTANHRYPLVTPVPADAAPTAGATIATVPANLASIGADQVWSRFGTTGEGVTVATIDTGVWFNHPLLERSYRGSRFGPPDHHYNWFDFTGECPAPEPCDDQGHGTEVTGVMVGSLPTGSPVLGVAPGAKWIATKACVVRESPHEPTDPPPTTIPLSHRQQVSCDQADLIAAGQWMLAPTDLAGANPDPAKAPDIVNVSLGFTGALGPFDRFFYQPVIEAWVSAGIFPVFAAGNDGPGCLTMRSPADNGPAYAVGALNPSNTIADFSSRGPAQTSNGTWTTKPNLTAPGVDITTTAHAGSLTKTTQGTSVAAPHVAGTVALIWSAGPQVRGNVALTRSILDGTARRVLASGCTTSGGTAPAGLINAVYGFGRLDALDAVRAVADPDPLQAQFTAVCLPPVFLIPKQCAFDASAATGPIRSYTWDFGTGNAGFGQSGRPVVHTYPSSGTYQVRLTVRSLSGATHTVTKPVTVP